MFETKDSLLACDTTTSNAMSKIHLHPKAFQYTFYSKDVREQREDTF